MSIGLISCCSTKLDHSAPASELYCSPLFRAAKKWVSQPGSTNTEWGILSARHGLVMPSDVLEPYDTCLADMAPAERSEWAERTHEQIRARWGDGTVYRYVLGENYRAAMDGFPFREDMIRGWTELRIAHGMSR